MGLKTYWADYMKYINLYYFHRTFTLLSNFVKNNHYKIKDLYLTFNTLCQLLRKFHLSLHFLLISVPIKMLLDVS